MIKEKSNGKKKALERGMREGKTGGPVLSLEVEVLDNYCSRKQG